MNFHHIGIATKDINKTANWVKKNFEVIKISEKVFDALQDANLQIIETRDVNIELVSGAIVEKFIKKNITYYHICYEVDDMDNAIKSFSNSVVISKPTPAILFENRLVAFLITPIGLIELLQKEKL